jgi:streptogramin lyase
VGDGEFGGMVALSSDGETALIGDSEATYVFTGAGSNWTQQATLPAGTGVALSGDGETVLIASSTGTLVFTGSGATWTQQATLAAGASVALSADGTTALIGAPAANGDAGAAWVYTRSGETWSRLAELTPAEEAGASQFGYSVALSGDGGTALVGAPEEQPGGAAWVFSRSGEAWSQQGPAIPGPEDIGGDFTYHMEFATGVALSADGNIALIGGDNHEAGHEPYSPNSGAAWAYTRFGSSWKQPGTELAGNTSSIVIDEGNDPSKIRESVALSADGDTALIGGDLGTGLGGAWSFSRSGETWDQNGTELQGSEEIGNWEGLFGAGVALSSSADTALIGDPRDNGGVGAAWIFAPTPAVTALDPSAGPAAGGTMVTITGTNFSEAAAVSFGSVNAPNFTVNSESSITAEAPPGAGTVDVTVTSAQGTSPSVPADRFRYPPAVTNVSPDGEFLAGGASVTISGAGFEEVAAVRFGSVSAAHSTVNSESSITAEAPPGAGTVDVTVTTAQGTSPATAADRFAYADVTTFSTGEATLGQIVTGTDGNLWFIGSDTGVGRLTPQGGVTLFTEDSRGTPLRASALVAGSAGELWAGAGESVRELRPENGVIVWSEFTGLPYPVEALTLGQDGVVCYAGYERRNEKDYVGCGQDDSLFYVPETISENVIPAMGGSNDDLWFSWDFKSIVRATIGGGERQYPVGGEVSAMTVGPGDDLWFAERGADQIGRLTAEGVLTRFSEGVTGSPGALTTGPEGDIWFTEPGADQIGRITPEGVVTQFPEGISSAPESITAGPEGDIWFTEESGQIGRLTLEQTAPAVQTGAASSIGTDAATLGATVNPEGEEVTRCDLEYGATASYGSSVPCSAPPGAGNYPVAVSAELGTLTTNTTYHFRFIATNATGTSYGSDQTFTTLPPPPTVVTGAASAVELTSATLNATVDPNGAEATGCYFEYGPTASYGSSLPCSSLPGSGESPVAVSASITGLTVATTYHYRIAATNAEGTSRGADREFTTAGPPEFGRCAKVAHEREGAKTVYHGGFTSSTCLSTNAAKVGKYEWHSGVSQAPFTLTAAAATLETASGANVTCSAEDGGGRYSGVKEVSRVVVRFFGCESSGQKCTTPELTEGDLESTTLEGELGWEAKARKKVALDLYPIGKTGPFLEYRCGGAAPITVTGSILVRVTADKMKVSSPLKYRATRSFQEPQHLEGEANDVLTASLNGEALEQLGLTAAFTQVNEEAVEINTVV